MEEYNYFVKMSKSDVLKVQKKAGKPQEIKKKKEKKIVAVKFRIQLKEKKQRSSYNFKKET